MSRRAFLDRLSAIAGGTAAASLLLPILENNYAKAETIAESDAPGVIRQIEGNRFSVGELDGAETTRVKGVSELFRKAAPERGGSKQPNAPRFLYTHGPLREMIAEALAHNRANLPGVQFPPALENLRRPPVPGPKRKG